MAVVDSVVIQEGQNLPGKCGGRVAGLEEFRKHFGVASSSFYFVELPSAWIAFQVSQKGIFFHRMVSFSFRLFDHQYNGQKCI